MAVEDGFSSRIERWFKGLEKDIEIDERDLEHFDSYIMESLKDADSSADSDPNGAYSKIVKLAGVAGHLARKKPFIVEILGKYIQHFESVMKKIEKALGATSFTITVSFPFDLSISLTF